MQPAVQAVLVYGRSGVIICWDILVSDLIQRLFEMFLFHGCAPILLFPVRVG